MIIYGPKPGTEVDFDLTIEPKSEIDDGKGGKIPIPPPEGVEGRTVHVWAKVPSESARLHVNGILSRSRVERIEGGGGGVKILAAHEVHEAWQAEVLRQFLVKLEGLELRDGDDDPEPLALSTPDLVIEHAESWIKLGLAEVLSSRTKLSEALRGNSNGPRNSSPPDTSPSSGTAGRAGRNSSAKSAHASARRAKAST